ncbi:kinase-like protein [Auricularia subglabra TFB-10046 SS5]|nr:kinase-like protein [Auricularia subglabra TFB-10046 SS5]
MTSRFHPVAHDMEGDTSDRTCAIGNQDHGSENSVHTFFICKSERTDIRIWFSRVISRGMYGVVFAANVCSEGQERPVTVRMFPQVMTAQQRTTIYREVTTWTHFEHPRVLPVLGVCDVGVMQLGVVTPYMANGNLLQFVQRKPAVSRASLIQEAAEGLRYLHLSAGIVHGDLNCDNVLISPSESVLVGGFGWSTLVEQSLETSVVGEHTHQNVVLSAPELLSARAASWTVSPAIIGPRRKTQASDVYAFGMLIYQAIAGQLPWADLHYSLVGAKVTGGEMPARCPVATSPSPFSDELWELCLRCWNIDPQLRPDSSELVTRLSESALLTVASHADTVQTVPFTYNGGDVSLDIDLSHSLGRGSSGVVFKGIMCTEAGAEIVAVKLLAAVYTVASSEVEVETWKSLRHPRILPFYGSCNFGLGQLCLISPHMDCGDMKTFLENNRTTDRARLLRQVAEALVYLHVDAGRVHGDIKCVNVMISSDQCALLADFGLSTAIERTEPTLTKIRRRCTVAFAAPELLDDTACSEHGILLETPPQTNSKAMKPRSKTVFSDIYAFGMLMYEAYAGATPWEGLQVRQIAVNVIHGRRPERPMSRGYAEMSDELPERSAGETEAAAYDVASIVVTYLSALSVYCTKAMIIGRLMIYVIHQPPHKSESNTG